MLPAPDILLLQQFFPINQQAALEYNVYRARTIIAVSFCVCSTHVLSADDVFFVKWADVAFGYSFVSSGLTFNSSSGSEGIASAGRASLNGWDASASLRVFHWLRAAADVSASYGSVPVSFFTLLGSGSRMSIPTCMPTCSALALQFRSAESRPLGRLSLDWRNKACRPKRP